MTIDIQHLLVNNPPVKRNKSPTMHCDVSFTSDLILNRNTFHPQINLIRFKSHLTFNFNIDSEKHHHMTKWRDVMQHNIQKWSTKHLTRSRMKTFQVFKKARHAVHWMLVRWKILSWFAGSLSDSQKSQNAWREPSCVLLSELTVTTQRHQHNDA